MYAVRFSVPKNVPKSKKSWKIGILALDIFYVIKYNR